uniref:MBD domain-containing protein n=1 Tax=Meloidogyne hapla TaxID=6305 RepID=A0A1I8BKH6_MELHA
MDEDNEGAKFGEEDIDTILERRAQTIKLEPGVKGSTFAKASFTFSHNRDDIDISDPDFWSKWAKKANIDAGALHGDFSSKHLILHEQRSRKKRFEDDNFKANSESADDVISDDDDRHVKGSSRIAENVKNRSVRKKRRASGLASAGTEDDYDYAFNEDDAQLQGDEIRQRHKVPASGRHPELACTITQLKKVEKLLMQWGWGRWSTLKQFSELSEHELEHISRTLLLHCIREFRGDEKTQEFVWNLITPPECQAKIGEIFDVPQSNDTKASSNCDSKSKFYQGWAQKPEYNTLQLGDVGARAKETLAATKQLDVGKQGISAMQPSEDSASVSNTTTAGQNKHKIPIKASESFDIVTCKAKLPSSAKQLSTGRQNVSTTASTINSSEKSTSFYNKSSLNELTKMINNPEYMLQLLAMMSCSTESSSSLGMNSLMNSLISSPSPSTSSTYSATLNQQLQTLLALTSLTGTTDLSTNTNSSLTTAFASLLGNTGSSVNIGLLLNSSKKY